MGLIHSFNWLNFLFAIGFINGVSRFCCGLFALVTPALVVPSAIRGTMFGFAALLTVGLIGGLFMIAMQKKYNVREMEV